MTARADTAAKTVASHPAPPPTAVPPSPAPPLRSAAARPHVSRKSLVLSVLVVLLGGLVAFAAGQLLTARTDGLAVARDVQVGSTITADDLAVASVTSDPRLSPIPAAEQSQVIGMVAQVPLVRGGLLTRTQVGVDSGLAAGEVLVALPMKEGQFPARGLTAGQRVMVVPTPGSAGASSAAGAGGGVAQQLIEATVAEVGPVNPTTQVTVVDVRLRGDDGPTVAQLASTGNLALILLPGGG